LFCPACCIGVLLTIPLACSAASIRALVLKTGRSAGIARVGILTATWVKWL
jgi:hypothetical protein